MMMSDYVPLQPVVPRVFCDVCTIAHSVHANTGKLPKVNKGVRFIQNSGYNHFPKQHPQSFSKTAFTIIFQNSIYNHFPKQHHQFPKQHLQSFSKTAFTIIFQNSIINFQNSIYNHFPKQQKQRHHFPKRR